MGIFSIKKKSDKPIASAARGDVSVSTEDNEKLALLALKTIQDGVLILNKDGLVKFINPAAVEMTGCKDADNAINLDYSLVMKLEKSDGSRVDENNNEFLNAIKTNQAFESRDFVLVSKDADKKTPMALRMTPSGDGRSDRIITFRNIAKELEEEGAQTEFISTASHEMRTPVASIEGYLGLALNPQTATIDARARQYLESAHSASQHLGNLFRDLLDVTKLDDKRIRTHLVPLELTGFVKKFADEYIPKFNEKHISYSFGAEQSKSQRFSGGKTIEQVVYTFVDVDFLGEILANLIENAIKYTPEGGAVWVNVQGDGDRALINVTDTGIGVAAEDLQHIFQKFYRADNSHTRTVGGTGLGLYLVKQRVEAMSGRVWAESAFGEGSTFYVSLPRLTSDEYEKRQIAEENQKAVQAFAEKDLKANIEQNASSAMVLPNSILQQVQTPVFQSSAMAMTGIGQTIQPAESADSTEPAEPVESAQSEPEPTPEKTEPAEAEAVAQPATEPVAEPTSPEPTKTPSAPAPRNEPVTPIVSPAPTTPEAETAPAPATPPATPAPATVSTSQPVAPPSSTPAPKIAEAPAQPAETAPTTQSQPMQNNQNIIQ